MSRKPLEYDKIVETALRGVVTAALRQVAEHGLPPGHALYITFLTDLPGVEVPEVLSSQFPGEMTIVLQHQFWDLDVTEDEFAVSLSFDRMRQRLVVPLAAVTAFADPAVQFGLKFEVGGKVSSEPRPVEAQDQAAQEGDPEDAGKQETEVRSKEDEGAEAEDANEVGQVVNLDSFRKK